MNTDVSMLMTRCPISLPISLLSLVFFCSISLTLSYLIDFDYFVSENTEQGRFGRMSCSAMYNNSSLFSCNQGLQINPNLKHCFQPVTIDCVLTSCVKDMLLWTLVLLRLYGNLIFLYFYSYL